MLPTKEDHAKRQRRQAWWLLVARLCSGRTQQDAAVALGLKASSSYSDLERGITPPSLRQLATLAALFDFPLAKLVDPDETDEERYEAVTGRRSSRTGEEQVNARRRRTG